MLSMTLPLKVISEANSREGWRSRWRRKVAQQKEIDAEWKARFKGQTIKLPCVVTLTRIAPKLLDSDNLAGSFKFCQDQIAKLIGIDDGSSLIRFEYKQEAIGKRKYFVRIEVEAVK